MDSSTAADTRMDNLLVSIVQLGTLCKDLQLEHVDLTEIGMEHNHDVPVSILSAITLLSKY